jgi:hypothetical protein
MLNKLTAIRETIRGWKADPFSDAKRLHRPPARVRMSSSSPFPSASSGFTAGRQLESLNFISPMKNRRKKLWCSLIARG